MHETMAEHYRQFPHDGLSKAILAAELSNTTLVVLRFNASDNQWRPWRPS
jgi:hypothetical protein